MPLSQKRLDAAVDLYNVYVKRINEAVKNSESVVSDTKVRLPRKVSAIQMDSAECATQARCLVAQLGARLPEHKRLGTWLAIDIVAALCCAAVLVSCYLSISNSTVVNVLTFVSGLLMLAAFAKAGFDGYTYLFQGRKKLKTLDRLIEGLGLFADQIETEAAQHTDKAESSPVRRSTYQAPSWESVVDCSTQGRMEPVAGAEDEVKEEVEELEEPQVQPEEQAPDTQEDPEEEMAAIFFGVDVPEEESFAPQAESIETGVVSFGSVILDEDDLSDTSIYSGKMHDHQIRSGLAGLGSRLSKRQKDNGANIEDTQDAEKAPAKAAISFLDLEPLAAIDEDPLPEPTDAPSTPTPVTSTTEMTGSDKEKPDEKVPHFKSVDEIPTRAQWQSRNQ